MAITDIVIHQRDTLTTFEKKTITGSGNLGKALGFNSSTGVLEAIVVAGAGANTNITSLSGLTASGGLNTALSVTATNQATGISSSSSGTALAGSNNTIAGFGVIGTSNVSGGVGILAMAGTAGAIPLEIVGNSGFAARIFFEGTAARDITIPDSSGTLLVNGGALGAPSSGTVTNLTGTASININGTVGATTPAAGSFTTLAASGTITASNGTITGGAGNMTITAGTGNSRTLALRTTNSGGSAVTVLSLTDTNATLSAGLSFDDFAVRTVSIGSISGVTFGASSSLIGLWGASPTTRPTSPADASGGTVVDDECRAALNDLLSKLRTIGLLAA